MKYLTLIGLFFSLTANAEMTGTFSIDNRWDDTFTKVIVSKNEE